MRIIRIARCRRAVVRQFAKPRSALAALDQDYDWDSSRRSKSDRRARAGATKNLRTKIGLMSPTEHAVADADLP